MPKETTQQLADRVTKDILSKYSLVAVGEDAIYQYDPSTGIYADGARTFLGRATETALGEDSSNYMVNEVVGKVKRLTGISPDKFDSDPTLLNVANGVLDLETMELHPHSPDYYFLRRVPVTYDPDAKCPRFERFLDEVLYAHDNRLIRQMIGYILLPDYRYHNAFILVGSGRNGKTTLLNVLQRFIGWGNYSTLTLQQLCNEKFQRAELFGKMANIAAEMGNQPIKDTEPLLSLSGESSVSVEKKNQDPFTFSNKAKLIFACNEIPPAVNPADAYYQRWIILPFPRTFSEHDPTTDSNLEEKLTTEEELSGLLNLALAGRNSLLRQRSFAYPHRGDQRKMLYMAWGSRGSVQRFVANNLVLDPAAVTPKTQIYAEYIRFCIDIGKPVRAMNWFFHELVSMIGRSIDDVRLREGDDRGRGLAGVRLSRGNDITVGYVSIKPSEMDDSEPLAVAPVAD